MCPTIEWRFKIRKSARDRVILAGQNHKWNLRLCEIALARCAMIVVAMVAKSAHGSRAEVWFEAAGEDVVLPNWKVSGESF